MPDCSFHKESPKKETSAQAAQSGGRVPQQPPALALPHVPGVRPGAVDVTGIVPDDIRVDPYFTEGQPGYEESGESEIIPMERLTSSPRESTAPEEKKLEEQS
ncbi:MAG: hypothetical protein C4297_03920 [Gemmataceae bacterium]